MNELEQGLNKVFNRCAELFEAAEAVFPEEQGGQNNGYWFNLEDGQRVHMVLSPRPESIETILANPRLREDPNFVPYWPQDECWPVTRAVPQNTAVS